MSVGIAAGALASARRAVREATEAARSANERRNERESVLGAVVEAAPMAVVLLRPTGSVVFANPVARELFFEGQDAGGKNLLELVGNAPAPFRDALLGDEDALFTVGGEGEAETYHLAKRGVTWEGDELTVVIVRHLTRELRRQEVAVWKKLLRVISHELNNSLAPISSMAHSARAIAKKPDKAHLLDDVFATIEERTMHLKAFLEGYADLARLPAPRRAHVAWAEILPRVKEAWPGVTVAGPLAGTGWLDRAQVEQLVTNLLKNAEEAGGTRDGVSLEVRPAEGGFEVVVRDRGPGMSGEVLQKALLPFYSTKERGTGLGLALCREIVEAHRGKLRIARREGGGLVVSCSLPGRNPVALARTGRLTLTRG